ncbi:MAG: hypothetical protein U9R68_10740, partial [Planctomycetota bacterium]|nr:hypothetical protein [Planctomycetota bacterium]
MAREHAGRRTRRIAWGLGAALALVLLLGGRAARGIEFKPPPPPEHERVAGITPEGLKLYRLPADWQAPSGGIDQKAVVAQQKKRREAINNAIGIDLQMAETPHYLIFSNASPTVS